MNANVGEVMIPASVKKWIRMYEHEFASRLSKHVEHRMLLTASGERLSVEDVQECVAQAHAEYLAELHQDRPLPQPHIDIIKQSLAAIEEGKTTPVQDVINDLQGRGG